MIDGWLNVTTGWYNDQYDKGITIDGEIQQVWTDDGQVFNYTEWERGYFYNVTLANGTFFYTTRPGLWDYGAYNETTERWDYYYSYTWDINGSLVVVYNQPVVEVTVVYPENMTMTDYLFQGYWYPRTSYSVMHPDPNMGTDYVDSILVETAYGLTNGTYTYEIYAIYMDDRLEFFVPRFNFTLGGMTYNITGYYEPIYKAHKVFGFGRKLDYKPLPITAVREQYVIVVGTPKWGMWDIQTWAVDPATGALDLDGDLKTKNDQYYVRNSFESTDMYNVTEQYLWVSIMWEPNKTRVGDEFYVDSYTGLVTVNWTYYWADNYYWFNASTGAPLTPAEFAKVNSTIFDKDGVPRPGYWGISWMAQNFTSHDLKKQAEEEGWDWAIQDSQEWSWIWWQMSEHYGSEMPNGTFMSVDVWYEYAGIFAWNDTNSNDVMDFDPANIANSEATHYWLPQKFEGVTFTTPNGSAVGDAYWNLTDTVPFGVTFENITGMVFPFGSYSYFDWYQGPMAGSDFAMFDERPTKANVTQFNIGVQFHGQLNNTGTNQGIVKFNLTMGDWNIDAPGGRSVLTNRSLGIAFYTDVLMVSENGVPLNATYLGDNNQPLSNNQTTPSANYTLAAEAAQVASMNLGGQHYIWAKNKSANYTIVDAQTVPVAAFEAAYASEAGFTTTPFAISTTQFYTLINFKWWDGYAVSVDPVFVGYSSSKGVTDTEPPSIDSLSTETRFVDGKERLYFEVTATDEGGSGIMEVRVVNLNSTAAGNWTLDYNGDTKTWTGYIEMEGTTPYTQEYRIEVFDYAGNWVASEGYTHKFWNDPDAPTMTGVSAVPTDSSQSAIVISVTVEDVGASGVDKVEVYIINTDERVTMTYNAGTDKYEATVSRTSNFAYELEYKIYAYDRAGNVRVSTQLKFYFKDAVAPVIDSVKMTKGESGGLEVLNVEATVTDVGGSGLATVQLTYIINSTSTTVDMTYDSATHLWKYTIPNQPPGTWVHFTITAADNEGNSVTSTEYSYQFTPAAGEDYPPSFGTVSITPQSPTPADDVNVTVTITDDGTIVNASIYYTVDDATWVRVSMSHSGTTYWGIIPAQPDGTTVTYYIEAYDNAGQRSATANFSYTVSGVVDNPPTISSVSIDNPSPTSSDSVTVTAVVSDDYGIKNVTLYYRVGDGNWVAVSMTSSDSSTYTGVIPAQPDGSVVSYYVRVFDTAGQYTDSGIQSYTVSDQTSTTTTTSGTTTTGGTTGTTEAPPMDFALVAAIGGVAVVVIVLVLVLRKRQ
ncbi:MAG: Ig-like domain repeat protein [Candidatus Thorarchaeota archaeon]